jgi:hypothetical protein
MGYFNSEKQTTYTIRIISECFPPYIFLLMKKKIETLKYGALVRKEKDTIRCKLLLVRDLLDMIHNVILIKCIFGSGKPRGGGILGKGSSWLLGEQRGVSLQATGSRGGRILTQKEGSK